jgi:hypothetical protein
MFGFFKKKKPSSSYEAFLSWPDDEFVVAVQKILSENVPASHAMYVVAYQNQAPMMTAIERLPMEDPSRPWNTCEAIKIIAKLRETHTDEIVSRRLSWFFGAFLVKEATERALGKPDLEDTAAEIWLYLIRGSAHIKQLLEHNVVWSEDEKEWFSLIQNESDAMRHTISYVLPKSLRQHPKIKQFEQDHGWISLGGSLLDISLDKFLRDIETEPEQ